MQANTLQRKNPNKRKKKVGRGGKRGTTAGRGTKGQKAHGVPRPELRDLIKKLPKKRGYRFSAKRNKPVGLSLSALDASYSDGAEVNPKTLLENGLSRPVSGRVPKVKILGNGEITKKLTLSGVFVTASALDKIKKAGGKVEEVQKRKKKVKKVKKRKNK